MNTAAKPRFRRGREGFTLLELLVAAALGAAIVGLLATVAMQALGFWNRVGGNIASAAQARFVLDRMEADLTCALARADGKVWMAADVLTATTKSGVWVAATAPRPTGAESLRLDKESIADCRFGVAGTWLRFIAGSSCDSGGSTVAIGYQIVRRNITSSSASEIAYELYRSEVSAGNTFAAGYDLDPVAGGYTTPSAATETGAGTILRPHRNRILADHVVDLGIRLYVRGSDGLVPHFPAIGEMWSNGITTYRLREGGAGTAASRRPDVVEIMVRVLTEEGARQLRLFEDRPAGYASSQTWWEIVERNSQVVTRRVALPFAR